MDRFESLFPWLCLAILLVTIAGLAFRSRSRVWLSDTHLNAIAQPRLRTVLRVFALAGIAIAVLLGIFFLVGGQTYGWGFFALAADGIFLMGFYVWVAGRTFEDEC